MSSLPTPVEMAAELESSFIKGQAETIAAELYQPLRDKIERLENKLDHLTRGIGTRR